MAGATIEGVRLYTSPYVVSPLNLTCFLQWAQSASLDDLESAFEQVDMLEHRMSAVMFVLDMDGDITITRPDLDVAFTLRSRMCDDPACSRCLSGRGGWAFRWIGPWTCPAIIGDETTGAQEVYQRAMRCQCGRH